jgi:hypothetical protein
MDTDGNGSSSKFQTLNPQLSTLNDGLTPFPFGLTPFWISKTGI